MKLITLEEHYMDPAIAQAAAPQMSRLSPGFQHAYDGQQGLAGSATAEDLLDLGERRLSLMDQHGIDVQILSALNAQLVPGDVAPELCRAANDTLARTVRDHPDRFAAFAALPTAAPEAAGEELRRAMGELGAVGTLVFGRTDGQFLSHERFAPVLQAASDTDAPIYLHPSPAPQATTAENYAGFDEVVSTRLQTAAWGWHMETGIHFLHLVLSGAFDRHPNLRVVMGHWGEMVPFFMDRLEEMLPSSVTGLQGEISDYVKKHLWITPSGMFTQAHLQFCLEVLGAERIMYSVDYPFIPMDDAHQFLAEAQIPEETKEAIAHRNAEAFLGL